MRHQISPAFIRSATTDELKSLMKIRKGVMEVVEENNKILK